MQYGEKFVKPRFSQTEGRCHELATKTVLWYNPDADLVVGKYYGFLGHSWVMKGDRVYDPVQGLEMSWGEYESTQHAAIFQKYSAAQVRVLWQQTGHYPPWENLAAYQHFLMGKEDFAELS